MDGRTLWKVVLGIVVVVLLIGVGIQLYEVGVAQGLARGNQVATARPDVAPGVAPQPGAASQPGVAPYPYYGYGRHWHWGFPFFALLIPLLFFLLIFALFRAAWHGPRGWGGWGGGAPSTFEEWHRRAHQGDQPPREGQATT
jgi:hypothetical protein